MMQRYPAYKDSGFDWLQEVPEHWEQKSIRALTKVKTERNKPDLPLLSVYRDYGVIYKDSRDDNHNRAGMDLSSYKVVAPNNLVLNKMKTWQGSLGVSQFEGIVSPAYIVCDLDEGMNGRYLNYLLRCRSYVHAYNRISYGVRVDQWDMRYEDFKQLPVFLPSSEEQAAIVAFLEEQTAVINQFLTNKRRLIALLEEQKQVVINTAVTQGLDTAVSCKPSGIDNLGDIPAHWQMLRNKYIFTEVADRSETGEELQLSVHQQLGIIPRSEIADRPMEESPTIGSKRCQVGDLILNRLKAHLGVFFRTELDGVVSPDYTVFRPKRDVSTKYFEYLFRHPVYMGIWNKTVRGIVAGFYRLYTDDFGNVASVFPPPDEQRAIVKFIDEKTAEINTAIERTQREIELIEEYRTTLIAHAVTGKIDVSGARHGP